MVRHFQSVIGAEARRQVIEQAAQLPAAVVACVGGGSNAIGIFSGFEHDESVRLIGVEAGGAGPELGRHAARFAPDGGRPGVLQGTLTYVLQDADGQIASTHSVSAGLDYPAVGPEHAFLRQAGRAEYTSVSDDEALAAFHALSEQEGIIPALESAHAVAYAMRLAATLSPEQIVVINLSGRGDKDVETVQKLSPLASASADAGHFGGEAMSAIANAFARVRREGRGGFIPYITAGDPDLAATYDILLALGRAGATVIELGFPFSDPMADGPVIQRACARALKNRVTMRDVLEVAREAKSKLACPVVLFSYLNPVLQYGLERMITTAGENGISGLLLTDLPADNAARLGVFAREHQVDLITLAAPTCTDERLKIVCAHASGFIYAVSRTGVTGTRRQLSDDARLLVERIRRFSSLPVALGFGVSTGQQAREVLTLCRCRCRRQCDRAGD